MGVTRVGSQDIRDGGLTDQDVNPANKDGLPGVHSLRTLGTGPQQAAAGDDPRFPTFVDNEEPVGVPNGGNLPIYALSQSPIPDSLRLFMSGVLMLQGDDYTLSGNTITFAANSKPKASDWLRAWYRV